LYSSQGNVSAVAINVLANSQDQQCRGSPGTCHHCRELQAEHGPAGLAIAFVIEAGSSIGKRLSFDARANCASSFALFTLIRSRSAEGVIAYGLALGTAFRGFCRYLASRVFIAIKQSYKADDEVFVPYKP
jgi:hypothetical protein